MILNPRKMARNSCGTCSLVTATILGPIVMILLAVSFATDYWLEFDVKRERFATATRNLWTSDVLAARYTHSRHRGLFRECYPGNDTAFLENRPATAEDVIDNHCFNVHYDIPEEWSDQSWTDDFTARIHLMRCWLAFFIIALVVFLTAYIFGLVLCCWRQSKWAYIAGLCAYIAAFSVAASIAFFHGAEYLERNKIAQRDPYMGLFYLSWSTEIVNATSRDYGYSYIIGWVGMVLAALTATFYSIAGCYIGKERYEDKYMEKNRYVADRGYPMILETPQQDPYYGGYNRGGYQGPYVYDMDNRQQLPALTYGPEPLPAQNPQWRWA